MHAMPNCISLSELISMYLFCCNYLLQHLVNINPSTVEYESLISWAEAKIILQKLSKSVPCEVKLLK
jgi:hypothetical protein